MVGKLIAFPIAILLGVFAAAPLVSLFELLPFNVPNPFRLLDLLPSVVSGAFSFFFLLGFAGFLLWMFCRLFTSTETLRTLFIVFSAVLLVFILPGTWIPTAIAYYFVFYLAYRFIPFLRAIREGEEDVL